jgi:hypothetical protein
MSGVLICGVCQGLVSLEPAIDETADKLAGCPLCGAPASMMVPASPAVSPSPDETLGTPQPVLAGQPMPSDPPASVPAAPVVVSAVAPSVELPSPPVPTAEAVEVAPTSSAFSFAQPAKLPEAALPNGEPFPDFSFLNSAPLPAAPAVIPPSLATSAAGFDLVANAPVSLAPTAEPSSPPPLLAGAPLPPAGDLDEFRRLLAQHQQESDQAIPVSTFGESQPVPGLSGISEIETSALADQDEPDATAGSAAWHFSSRPDLMGLVSQAQLETPAPSNPPAARLLVPPDQAPNIPALLVAGGSEATPSDLPFPLFGTVAVTPAPPASTPSSSDQPATSVTASESLVQAKQVPDIVAAAAAIGAASAGSTSPEVVSAKTFRFVLNYAGMVTLALLYLLYTLSRQKAHWLESLPDIKPAITPQGVTLKLANPEHDVAPGHRLQLGETRRFGDVVLTPMRVTKGGIAFQHFQDPKRTRDPVGPVLKLWLRIENASRSLAFVPLDRELLLLRAYDDRKGTARANNFLVTQAGRKSGGEVFLLYDLPPTSEFMIVGQTTDTPLEPGEAIETFIPSDEDAPRELTGPLVWRCQFRKGHNLRTGNGVTTLVDVEFDSSEVTAEAGS